MIYIGIDITRLNHLASVLSSDGEILMKLFRSTNDNDGFYELISSIEFFRKNSLIIGLDPTDHYDNKLVEFLVSKHHNVCVRFNPDFGHAQEQHTQDANGYIRHHCKRKNAYRTEAPLLHDTGH